MEPKRLGPEKEFVILKVQFMSVESNMDATKENAGPRVKAGLAKSGTGAIPPRQTILKATSTSTVPMMINVILAGTVPDLAGFSESEKF